MARRDWIALGTLALACAAAPSCRKSGTPEPLSVRLVDLYKPEVVDARQPAAAAPSRFEWQFKDGTQGWQAGIGITGLAVKDSRLVGRSSTNVPLLAVEIPQLPQSDVIHEVQVRMRVSEGADVAAILRGADPVDFPFEAELVRVFPFLLSSPLLPGTEMQTYALRASASILTRGRRRLLLRPTDRAGATFAIESIRLITEREHLAAVPSGLGWHGLSEVYRESLVARAPETMRFRVRLPQRPRLELALGTMETWPVRFRVSVGGAGQEETLAERTVTTADRWEPLALDLRRFAGREVTLSLGLSAEKPGTLGFWGAPVVRSVAEATGGGKPPVRGVILIWADTLRRDHLEAYGYARPTAPTVSALAQQGVRFTDCVAQASWTKVSGPSIFTSLYPATHGVTDVPHRLPAGATTLAEVFREAGWATVALSSLPFVGKMTNLHQGFEEFQESASVGRDFGASAKTARAQVDRLLPWLDAHRDVPFFALFHVADPHSPYRPDAPYDTMWADPARREEHERHSKAVRPFIAHPNLRRFGMPTRDELVKAGIDAEAWVAYERDWYDGSIRAMDAELGRVRERLSALGLDDEVVVAFISDHGTGFLDHGRMFHGVSVYGELTNVPLIFWGPGHVSAGKVVEGTVQLIDVMPTLLELAGLRPPPGIQGRSLASVLRAGAPAAELPARPAISEKHARAGAVGVEKVGSVALFSDGWKLIHNTERPAEMPEFELFDHRTDPLDRTDVAAQHPDVVARLAKEIATWRTVAERARLKPDGEGTAALGKEELERLRALGYVQ
jgi:arylsulfatase A-like enzyme